MEDGRSSQRAHSQADQTGQEVRVKCPGHEGHHPDPHHAGQADQGDHQEAVAPDLVLVWPGPCVGRMVLIAGVILIKERGADPHLETRLQLQQLGLIHKLGAVLHRQEGEYFAVEWSNY